VAEIQELEQQKVEAQRKKGQAQSRKKGR